MIKLSQSTLTILANFAAINPNFLLKPGNEISTIGETKTIMGIAEVPESFTEEFGIYDLPTFLSLVSLLGDPSIDFTRDTAVLSSGKQTVKYRSADATIITSPTKIPNFPSPDLTVRITSDHLAQIRKASQILNCPVATISGKNGAISLSVTNPKNTSSDTWSVELLDDSEQKENFTFNFLIANFKILPGSYDVSISKKLISEWKHESVPVKYFIAVETDSKFGS